MLELEDLEVVVEVLMIQVDLQSLEQLILAEVVVEV